MDAPAPVVATTVAVMGPKRRRRRNSSTSTLPPALAHELDVARAARMGIDISYMAPDERCKYPSKFCCNVRARKSTGKLHRFCEDHRSRANVNQKRWNEARRAQVSVQPTRVTLPPCTVCPTANAVGLVCVGNESIADGQFPHGLKCAHHSSTKAVDSVTCGDSMVDELKDDEIEELVAMVLDGGSAMGAFPECAFHPVWPAEFSVELFMQHDAEDVSSL